MDRGADQTWIAEIMRSSNAPVLMVEVHLDDGVGRRTDAWRNIVWGGNIYYATGHFLEVQGISETFDMSIPNVSVQLSGVDQEYIATILLKQFIDRRIVIRKAFIDYSTNALLGNPVIVFDGRMDEINLNDSPLEGKCVLTLSASSQFADFMRRPGRHTNPNEQRIYFPGDKGFDMVSNPVKKGMTWGG
ncbi:MAG: hypothetical protein H7839_04765 [Magnetococcus sp. YQC-5]